MSENIVVAKFGGTSLAGPDRLKDVVRRLASLREGGADLVVVVSAAAGETDRLMACAGEMSGDVPPRELDALLATGEQASAALLAIALRAAGVDGLSLSAHQVPIQTDDRHGDAQIEYVAPQRIRRHLDEGRVVVITGYQGVNAAGDLTTLGRGGSDLTAVALAGALNARICEIYTDVSGVFTADPRICGDARPIKRLSYDELLELASEGARVMQTRAVALARRYRIPLMVRSSFDVDAGTLVDREGRMENAVVSAVSCDRCGAQISLRGIAGTQQEVSRLFSALAENRLIVDVIVSEQASAGKMNLTLTVPRTKISEALADVRRLGGETGGPEVVVAEKVAKVSAVGMGLRTHSSAAARVFHALACENIPVLAMTASEIKISCVVDDRYAELAVRCLHDEFGLAKEPN